MKRRVLVVDDNVGIRQLVAATLDLVPELFEIVEAADGAAALAVLGERDVHAIVLDCHMAPVDGAAFADAYHTRRGPHAPIVAMSAVPSLAAFAARVGADAMLSKPFSPAVLLDILHRLPLSTSLARN